MTKFVYLVFALLALVAMSAPASAQAYVGAGIEVGVGRPAPIYGAPVRGIYYEEPRYYNRGAVVAPSQGCPKGYVPAGALGCRGATITDPAEMSSFAHPIKNCVEGAPLPDEWVDGFDPITHVKTRLLVKLHQECNRNHRG